MAFKGEIALGALNEKFKTGFTIGDIYRTQGAGNLVPNNLPVANGAFVEWTADGWKVKKDMQYAVSATGESLNDAIADVLDDHDTAGAEVEITVPTAEAANYTVGNYFEDDGKVWQCTSKTDNGDGTWTIEGDKVNGVIPALNELANTIDERVSDIEDIIPDSAASDNQLMTEAQVTEAMTEATSELATGYTPKGPASVATLNGLSGQENGWLYTLTDGGTLTDGSLAVSAGDSVAWDDANSVWYKAMDYATKKELGDVVDRTPYSVDYSAVSLNASMFSTGNIESNGTISAATSVMHSDIISISSDVSFVKASVLSNYRVGVAFYKQSSFHSRSSYGALGQIIEVSVPKGCDGYRVQFWKSEGGGDAVYADAGINAWQGEKDFQEIAGQPSVDTIQSWKTDCNGDEPVTFEQGSIYSASGYNAQNTSSWYNKAIRSNFIRVKGKFIIGVKQGSGFSCQIYKYDTDKTYIGSTAADPMAHYYEMDGYVRIAIYRSDNTELTPSDVTAEDVVLPTFDKNILLQAHEENQFMPTWSLDSSKVLDYLDGLAYRYSHYITQHGLLTMDSSGTKKINYYVLGTGTKKIAIVSGQHGPKSDPYDSVITLCALIRSLCENEFSKDDFLYKLKTEYTLYVIPILNPYGFDVYNESLASDAVGGRGNANGVNLNRDWAAQTQIETQKAAEALTSFAPDAVIDLHATGNYPGEGSFGGQWGWLSDKAKAIAFTNIINPAHWRDYNIESSLGYSDDMSTVSGTSLDSWSYVNLGCVGCTCECQYMIRAIPTELHTAQVESANFSFLVNTIAVNSYAAGKESSYSYIVTRPQKRA